MTVKRQDSGKLGKITRTASGGMRVPAAITRTGVFDYTNPDGSLRREYRPDAEVSNAASLAMLEDATVTNLHPSAMIDVDSWKEHTVGHVKSARMDGALVMADLVISDAKTIAQIDSGDRREVSCGYECSLLNEPGTTPDGERYDAIQTDIRYNHVALVPRGRAGREIALRLDSEGNQVLPPPQEKHRMKIEIINGIEHEVGTPAHSAAAKARDTESARLDAERSKLETELAEANALVGQIPALVLARVALVSKAAAHKVEVRADMSDVEIRSAILSKLMPSMDLSGKSEDYLAAALDLALSQPAPVADVRADVFASRTDSATQTTVVDTLPPDEIARQKSITAMRNAGAR